MLGKWNGCRESASVGLDVALDQALDKPTWRRAQSPIIEERHQMWGYQTRIAPSLIGGCASLWVGLFLAVALEASPGSVCEGPYTGGRQPSTAALTQVLKAHTTWLHTPQHPNAQRANLCGADLRGVRLSGMNLAQANLHGALLARALLGRANLQEADLRQANLQKAILGEADLQGANLQYANLSGAYLAGANLQRTNLYAANFREAILLGTDLREAQLGRADLRRAVAKHANLARSVLVGTDLREANLSSVNFGAAALVGVRLDGTSLMGTELTAVVFEPDVLTLPAAANFALARNLSRLTFQRSPHGLVTLREIFKQAGMRQEARALTFAIHRAIGQQASAAERAVRLIFFEWTCQYGMAPWRPLLLLGGLWLGGAFPYMLLLCRATLSEGWVDDARWRVLRHWAALTLFGLWLSLVAMLLLDRRGSLSHRGLSSQAFPGWVQGLATVQCFSGIYLLLLWGFMAFGHPFA